MTEHIKTNIQSCLKDDILAKADMCVYCGMCLPVCPTYQLSQQEAESPRGRLSLLTAYYRGELLLDDTLSKHLDHCLLCRSCESICPATVPFADIMDSARADMHESSEKKPILKRALLKLVESKRRTKFLVAMTNRLSLGKWLSIFPFAHTESLTRYQQIINVMKTAPKWDTYYPCSGQAREAVGLFLGCVHEFLDIDSLEKTIKVLNKLNVDVYVPERQQCCGAMHLHAGEKNIAESLYEHNKQAFAQYDITKVISLSSACTATLLERERIMLASGECDEALKVTDISSYLEESRWFENAKLATINATVLLHFPCTQKNVLKNTDIVHTMLSRIPGICIRELKAVSCCGAAGTYMLDNPEWSDKLKDKAAQKIDDDVDILATSNIGCLLQFRDIGASRNHYEVMHPINIVARSLRCE